MSGTDRIIDIETDGQHLAKSRGFLVVSNAKDGETGRVAFDNILAVIVHAHGVTFSNSLLTELGQRKILMLLCAANHFPVSILWPLEGYHAQGKRMRAQWNASRPLMKQLWKRLVKAKIMMQAAVAKSCGAGVSADLLAMAARVRSGDPENVEAQAARRYWPRLMGKDFRRDRYGGGVNGALNYGYTVLRAATARAVISSGLHPTVGLHHDNRGNAFALVDDVMEPFRPLVDRTAWALQQSGESGVTARTKQAMARLTALDLDFAGNRSPVSVAIQRLAFSIAQSFELGRARLDVPALPSLTSLQEMGRLKDGEI